MSNIWFRVYSEVLNDPKVQKLPDYLFKIWINILCIACNNDGTLPKQDECSFALRLPLHETNEAFQELKKHGLLVTDGETFHPHNWEKRQYKSDNSTERVKRHRNAKKTVSVTPPEQKQNRADTEPSPLPSSESGIAIPEKIPIPEHKLKQEKKVFKNDFGAAAAACCALLQRRMLSQVDDLRLKKWLESYDFDGFIKPLLIDKTRRFMEKNSGKAPASLEYFIEAVKEKSYAA